MRKPFSFMTSCSLLTVAAMHFTPGFSEAQSAPAQAQATEQAAEQDQPQEDASSPSELSLQAPTVWWPIGVVCSDTWTTATGVVYLCADQQARPDVLSIQANSCASALCSANGGFVADFALGTPSSTPCAIVNQCTLYPQ